MDDIFEQINNLPPPKKVEAARWVIKGMYGNGSAFAPFTNLYCCTNCGCLSVETFDKCPECNLVMIKEENNK